MNAKAPPTKTQHIKMKQSSTNNIQITKMHKPFTARLLLCIYHFDTSDQKKETTGLYITFIYHIYILVHGRIKSYCQFYKCNINQSYKQL